MMIHNLKKYHIQTQLRLWDIKITNFHDLLEICYFYISQTKSSLDKMFLQNYVSSYHLQYMGHVTYYLNYQYIRVRYFTMYLYQFVTTKQTVFESRCGKNRTGEMYWNNKLRFWPPIYEQYGLGLGITFLKTKKMMKREFSLHVEFKNDMETWILMSFKKGTTI